MRRVHRKIRIARFCLYFIVVKDLTISKYKQERQNANSHLKRVLVWFGWGFFPMVHSGLEIVGYFLIKIKSLEYFIWVLPG